MVKMSRRDRLSAIQEIRRWSTKQLQKFLTDHGLGECCVAIRKREVDGEAFLALTEAQLAFWKQDLNLATIRKLMHLVQDVNAQPEKYAQADNNIVGHGKVSAVDVPRGVSHIGNKQQVSSVSGKRTPPSDSWDTDFSDDDDINKACIVANPVTAEVETEAVYLNSEAVENAETYSNSEALENAEMYCNGKKPPVPVRPPALALKPASITLARSNSHNLPKPPVPVESITSLLEMIQLQELPDQFDEEDYDSFDKEVPASNKDALAALLKKSLENRAQAVKPPVPKAQPSKQMENIPFQSRTLVEMPQHMSAFPQQTHKEKSTQLPPGGEAEDYLDPLHKEESTGAPPLPEKQWTKPADAIPPHSKPPSPPRTKPDDSPNSPGSSGDGVTGWFGGILRKRRSPGRSSPQEPRGPLAQNLLQRLGTEMADVAVGMKRRLLYPLRRLLSRSDDVLPPDCSTELEERTPTFPASSHKPVLGNRPQDGFQGTLRPLPPTPGDSKVSEKPSAVGSSEISQQPWYHNVGRKQAEEMLRNGEDGSFLVRPSFQTQNPMTLTLWYKRRPYNISIRQRSDGRCALGTEKANEQSFASVKEMIQNYQAEKLVLYSGGDKVGRTVLKSSPPQGYQHSM